MPITEKWQFEMKVEQAALETVEVAKQISKSLGETSIAALEQVIINEFVTRLRTPSFFGEFQGKKTK